MMKCGICVAFLLSVYQFFSVPVRAGNITHIPSEQDTDGSDTVNISSKNTPLFGFGTLNLYDKKCDCGWGSSGCSYMDGKKVCNCDWKYSQNNDKCERCDCGVFSSKCYFENGKRICSCFGKYIQNGYDECAECDCGRNSISCDFDGYKKVCTCSNGYIIKSGKCEKCDCGLMSTSCELTFDLYTRCKCLPGYVAERSTWNMDEKCKLPGPSAWKIATYVESVVFGIIIIVCSILVFCNRKDD